MYKINNVEFVAKELTLNDHEKLDKYLKGQNLTDIKITSKDLKEILNILLIPKNEKTKLNNFDFGNTPMKVYMAVLKDFFSESLKMNYGFQKDLADLQKSLTEKKEKTKD